MAGREDDVVGGVNAFLEEQKKLPHPASLAMVRFDTGNIERFRTMGPLNLASPITRADYQPRGGTPLLDAVGQTIVALEDDWRREQPERAIVVIVTDGAENESRIFTKARVKQMIESRQASGLWAFIYLGANVDAFAEAGSMGILFTNSAGYASTAQGTAQAYNRMSASVSEKRFTGDMLQETTLGGNIEEDGSITKKTTDTTAAASSTSTPWTAPKAEAPWTPPQ